MLVNGIHYRTVRMDDGTVKMINQPLLPHKFEIYTCPDHISTAGAISTMIVRGAGAIGTAGGFGMAQAVLEAFNLKKDSEAYIRKARETLVSTRPTAQNLFYAVNKVYNAVLRAPDLQAACRIAVDEAGRIADEDVLSCRTIAEIGAELIGEKSRIMTHCNAGWLAFTDWGTALSPVFYAKREGRDPFVWVDETRPRLQGARLTAWELKGEGVRYTVIADNASGYFMKLGEVDLIIVGSDRIASNGDVANKIGTYEKAVLARENGIPFYVAAPTSTIDWSCSKGDDIPIEERQEDEVLFVRGKDLDGRIKTVRIVPEGTTARNPAFDVTPARFISGIITEKGLVKPDTLAVLQPAV